MRRGNAIGKRALACLLAGIVAVLLTGCGKPRGMTDDNYERCKQIIAVYDAYLDFKLTNKEAGEKIKNIAGAMDDKSTVMSAYFSDMSDSVGNMLILFDDPVDALKTRNNLAKDVGLPTR